MGCPAYLLEFDSSTPDPDLRGLRSGLNARIMDALLRHRHRLLQAENGLIRDVVAPLREARDEVREALARIAARVEAGEELSTLADLRAQRLRRLEARFSEILQIGNAEATEKMTDGLFRLARREGEIQRNLLQRAMPSGIDLDLVGPDERRLARIVNQPVGGKVWQERMAESLGESVRATKQSLTTSVALGEGFPEAGRRLASQVEKLSIQRATAIARTEVQRVANQTAVENYKRNQDVLKSQQWVATLDSRTCPVCGSLDGGQFPVGTQNPQPPVHVACRCFLSPVTKSFEELGLDASEFPASTRAAMDGQVPATVTYEDWIADQPEPFQREVFGPARFEKFKAGELELDGMVRNNKVIPVGELPEMSLAGP